jgi:hypothetical protein
MGNNTLKAADNPALANQLAQQAMSGAVEAEAPHVLQVLTPTDGVVTLPGGYLSGLGEVYTTAEVRELNGLDEEAISRQPTLGKSLTTILSRAVTHIGNEPVTETSLDNLLSGDADALMLGIYRATFGPTAVLNGYCTACSSLKQVEVNLAEDIPVKGLLDPVGDRVFTVKGKSTDYTVKLPSRKTQKEMIHNADKTAGELNSILLEGCVVEIGSSPVLSKLQTQAINLADRRTIIEAITSRNPGPQFGTVQVDCEDCGGKVDVPTSLGSIFRF